MLSFPQHRSSEPHAPQHVDPGGVLLPGVDGTTRIRAQPDPQATVVAEMVATHLAAALTDRQQLVKNGAMTSGPLASRRWGFLATPVSAALLRLGLRR
jgi:hypothetical protein